MVGGGSRIDGESEIEILQALAKEGIRKILDQKGRVEPGDLKELAQGKLRKLFENGRKLIVEKLSDGTWGTRFLKDQLGPVAPTVHASDLCYLCEQPGADTIEHVIARCFFAGTVQDNDGPLLPAHRACNSLCSAPEEYVRNTMVTFDDARGVACDAARASAQSAMNLDGKKTGVAAVHAKAKLMRARRELSRDGDHLKWAPERANQDRWNGVFFKIVRGLAYWHTGLLLPWPVDVRWNVAMPWEGGLLKVAPIRLAIGDGFEAQITLVTGGAGRAVAGDFRLTFYQGVHARLWFN